jgi:DNA-binding transcriptional LysR family regulator
LAERSVVTAAGDPPMRGRLVLTWRADARVSPAARALIAHARAEFGAPR